MGPVPDAKSDLPKLWGLTLKAKVQLPFEEWVEDREEKEDQLEEWEKMREWIWCEELMKTIKGRIERGGPITQYMLNVVSVTLWPLNPQINDVWSVWSKQEEKENRWI